MQNILREEKAKLGAKIEEALKNREDRIKEAAEKNQATRLWQLIVSAIEEGALFFCNLDQHEAKGMRGRQEPKIKKTRKCEA